MQVTLAQRAAPLLITTMLVAAPAWAQTTGSQTSPATAPPAATTTRPRRAG